MPTEIIGKIGSLYLEVYNAKGTLLVESSIPIKYGEKTEMKSHNISVPFTVADTDAINVIRKADNSLKLTGRFDNSLDERLVFLVNKAVEL